MEAAFKSSPHNAPSAFRSRLSDDLLRVPADSHFIDWHDEPEGELPGPTVLMGYVLTAFSGACVGSMLTSAAFLAWKWVA